MARRKTLPESVQTKHALAERLAALRAELHGERGGPEMARRLGIPVRTWYNYEAGVTVPAEVVLRIIELTSVEASWLLSGQGTKFRHSRPAHREGLESPATTIGALLRTALELLEKEKSEADQAAPPTFGHELDGEIGTGDHGTLNRESRLPEPTSNGLGRNGYAASQSHGEWEDAERENRRIVVRGDAMAPIVAEGATIYYAKHEEDIRQLDGKMIVAWLDNQPEVRWFQNCGRFALLRAENPSTAPHQVFVDLEDERGRPRFRRVLWINTPH